MGNSLDEAVKALNKKFGEKALTIASDNSNVRMIPLGIPMFDYITTGGIPVNRITELYGDYSSLKSYFSYIAIAKFQQYDWENEVPNVIESVTLKKGKSIIPEIKSINTVAGYKPKAAPLYKYCVLMDLEGTYDKDWGAKLGIDNNALIRIMPDSLNQAVDYLDAFLSNEDISLIVLDSMIAVGSDAEADASMEKEQMAVNARFWNKATRKIQGAINRNPEDDVTLIAINGFYNKVGVAFGNPEVVKNGEQFKLAKSMSIRTTALKTIKDKVDGHDVTIGRNITLRNKKNKVGRPFLEGSLYFSFVDDGELKVGETDIKQQLIDLASMFGLLERAGTMYTLNIDGESVKGRGMADLKSKLTPTIVNSLKELVYGKF